MFLTIRIFRSRISAPRGSDDFAQRLAFLYIACMNYEALVWGLLCPLDWERVLARLCILALACDECIAV
jgi:hypothetical protein